MGARTAEGRAPQLAVAGLAVTAASFLGAVAVEAANGSATGNGGGWRAVPFAVVVLLVPAVGALVAAKRPRNPLGWLTLAAPMFIGLALLTHAWAVYALRVADPPQPGGGTAAWLTTWLLAFGLGLLPFLLAAFPDGTVASWLHRPVQAGAIALVAICAAQALAPDHLDGVSREVTPIANPLGVTALRGAVNVVTPVAAAVLLLLFLASIGHLVVRTFRGTPTERRQLRWLVASLGFLPIGLVASVLVSVLASSAAGNAVLHASQLAAIVGSAASLTVGVLRHGMFDLRDYARRLTLSALLSTVVVVGFIVVVSVVATVTSASGAVPPAIAAAVVALALGPLRGRLQRGVNALIYGWRSEPYRVLADLGDRLEATQNADAALPAVVDTVASRLRLPYARIDLDVDGGTPVTVATAGVPVAHVVRLPIHDGGRRLGELIVGRRSAGEDFRHDELALLRTLARQAGTAAAAAQLTTALRTARARLVRGREDERQRLQRELHDGVGPALAGMSLQLDAALDSSGVDAEQTAELLVAMQRSLRATSLEVRRIAHDLRPGVLDELGLLEALGEQARLLTSAATPTLDLRLDLSARVELPAAVEVAVYRIASEALTNVVRHAQARTCTVRLCVDGQVELDIADDGVGFPLRGPSDGIGLRSMQDRAAELGGSFLVSPRSPTGTLIQVRLPGRA
jgi:two-component system NarL family sensor kinase